MRLRSLRALTLLFLTLFLVATVGTGLTTYLATSEIMKQLVDKRITAESLELAGRDGNVPPATVADRIAAETRDRDSADLGMVLENASGSRIAGNIRLRRSLPLGYSSLGEDEDIPGLTHGRAYVRQIGGGLRLTVIGETEPIDNYFSARKKAYILGFGLIVLIVMTGLVVFGATVSRRIGDTRRIVDAIIDGDLRQRIPVTGTRDGFDQQAEAFNRMLDRIVQLMAEIRNVTNDISHELRTPLARLRNQLALIQWRDEAEPVRQPLSDAIAQADDLLVMFAAILRIAEIESGARRAAFEQLSLGAVVREVHELLDGVAGETHHHLKLGSCPDAMLTGDRLLLTQMVINLVENGMRHTPEGSTVQIDVVEDLAVIRLIVADNGPGIPAEDRAQVMRRFGRLERSRRGEGHGLGLPLVDAIARLHGGSLQLADAGPGLSATITLPRA
ncbi:MAG: HAMP domain-containing histidine kinase [Sphingobium sp.]|nr:HAMP domain-containing histidine kinase [Sphingobium sp.]